MHSNIILLNITIYYNNIVMVQRDLYKQLPLGYNEKSYMFMRSSSDLEKELAENRKAQQNDK